MGWSSKMTCQQARMQLEDGNLNSKLQRTLWIANRQGGGCLSCRQGLWTRTTQHAQQHRKLPRRTPETPCLIRFLDSALRFGLRCRLAIDLIDYGVINNTWKNLQDSILKVYRWVMIQLGDWNPIDMEYLKYCTIIGIQWTGRIQVGLR